MDLPTTTIDFQVIQLVNEWSVFDCVFDFEKTYVDPKLDCLNGIDR